MNFGQLSEYPFNAQVWGTASDIAMVLVTGLTAWFLIKTFREQQKVTSFEEFKHIESIKPTFNLVYRRNNEEIKDGVFSAEFSFDISLNDHVAKDLEIRVYDSGTPTAIVNYWDNQDFVYPNVPVWIVTRPVQATYFAKHGEKQIYNFILKVNLDYKDMNGTNYIQGFFISDSDSEKTVSSGKPLRVDGLFREKFSDKVYRFVRKHLRRRSSDQSPS